MAQKRPEESPSRESNDPQKEKKISWIQDIANRSTGLPGQTSPEKESTQGKSSWSYAGIGIQFAGTVALFTVMGFFLDRQTGWTPWGIVSLSMLGVIGGLYLLIKELLKDNADPPKDGKT